MHRIFEGQPAPMEFLGQPAPMEFLGQGPVVGFFRIIRPMRIASTYKHVVVFTDSGWEKYSGPVDGYQMVGTVTRGPHESALAMRDGRYYAVNEGRCEPLVGRKIELGVAHATND